MLENYTEKKVEIEMKTWKLLQKSSAMIQIQRRMESY